MKLFNVSDDETESHDSVWVSVGDSANGQIFVGESQDSNIEVGLDGIDVRVSDLCVTNYETSFGFINLVGSAVEGRLSQGESVMLRPVPPFLVLD